MPQLQAPFGAALSCSLAQVLELLLLLMPVLLMPVLLRPVLLRPVPPPRVVSSRWLLLPVTAAMTHASCSGVVFMVHFTSRCECPIRRAGFSQVYCWQVVGLAIPIAALALLIRYCRLTAAAATKPLARLIPLTPVVASSLLSCRKLLPV